MRRDDLPDRPKTRRYRAKNKAELEHKLSVLERRRERSRTITVSVLVGLALVAMIAMVVLLTREGAERPQLEFINQGVVERSEAATALIVREEMLLPAPADGTLNRTIQEGHRVDKDGLICAVTPPELAERLQELYEVEDAIAVRQNRLVRRGDYKEINAIYRQSERELDSVLRALRSETARNHLQDLTQQQAVVDLLLSERKSALLDFDLQDAEIQALIRKRAELLEDIRSASRSIQAPRSGLVSYISDGLEEELTFEAARNLTPAELDDYLQRADLMRPLSQDGEAGQPAVRLVTDIRQYLVVKAPHLKAAYFDQNPRTSLEFRLDHENLVIGPCIIDRIIPDGEGTMLVLRTDKEMNELLDQRTITGSLRTSLVRGLKVPKDAVMRNAEDASLGWIMVVRRGYSARVPIRILDSDRTHSIIETTDENNIIMEGSIIIVNPQRVKEGEPVA
jgi:hypothetical protein